MKSEGIKFLYELFDSLGWDNVDMADIEVIMLTVQRMEKEDDRLVKSKTR